MTNRSRPMLGRVGFRGVFLALVFFVSLTLGLTGCGGGTAEVFGEVKYKGVPVSFGQIAFHGQGSMVGRGVIRDGKYTVPDAPRGAVKITVQSMQPPSKVGEQPEGTKDSGAPPPPPITGKYISIPKKYSNPDESGLAYTVVSGKQTKDFDLVP